MTMGRKPGFSDDKIYAIVKALYENPEGLWIRKLAEKTNLHPSTVTSYINNILSDLIDDTSLGSEKPILRVIKLKPYVIERLGEGMSITKILKMVSVIKNI